MGALVLNRASNGERAHPMANIVNTDAANKRLFPLCLATLSPLVDCQIRSKCSPCAKNVKQYNF